MAELPDVDLETPGHHRALAHPLRHRVLIALGEAPATVSQLARALGARKGNIAHHVGVLVEAGLVRVGEERQVRGGTERYYERAVRRIRTRGDDSESTRAMLTAVGAEIAGDADPLLHLRHVRLGAAAAAELHRTLERLVEQAADAGADAQRYGVLVAMYHRP